MKNCCLELHPLLNFKMSESYYLIVHRAGLCGLAVYQRCELLTVHTDSSKRMHPIYCQINSMGAWHRNLMHVITFQWLKDMVNLKVSLLIIKVKRCIIYNLILLQCDLLFAHADKNSCKRRKIKLVQVHSLLILCSAIVIKFNTPLEAPLQHSLY